MNSAIIFELIAGSCCVVFGEYMKEPWGELMSEKHCIMIPCRLMSEYH